MRVVFDIEADDLLENVSQIWCVVIRDVDTNEYKVYRPNEMKKAIAHLKKATVLIGHNIIGYDIPVFKKLFNFEPTAELFDTLVASRTIWPNIAERDFIMRKRLLKMGKDYPANLIGSHSLKAWGYRLGEFKGEWTDWSQFSEPMLEYCVQDTVVTKLLFERIMAKGFSDEAIRLEHRIHTALLEQQERGFPFDIPAATALFGTIAERKNALHETLVSTFEPTTVEMKTKTKIIPFNPASRTQIADRLMKKGWEPEIFTPSGEPKIDDIVLEGIDIPEVQMIRDYLMLNKRIGQVGSGKQAWLKLEKDGKIHGSVNHMGAVTSRCTHTKPNMAQVPSGTAEYGHECRALFYAPEGYTLVGADASGLELRCLGHFMYRYDGGAYANTVVNGDIHTVNQKAAGLPTRDKAKTFIYGYLYGAGDEKIGKLIGKGEKEGRKIKNAFLKQTPALAKLREDVLLAANTKKSLKGLDGRIIPVRHAHASLNTLLQSAGAIICKLWYCLIADEIKKQGLDAGIVAFIHDELQTIVRNDQVEAYGKITKDAMKQVEKHFNFRCALDSEWKAGKNWSETH
jgi:DNA polymerase I